MSKTLMSIPALLLTFIVSGCEFSDVDCGKLSASTCASKVLELVQYSAKQSLLLHDFDNDAFNALLTDNFSNKDATLLVMPSASCLNFFVDFANKSLHPGVTFTGPRTQDFNTLYASAKFLSPNKVQVSRVLEVGLLDNGTNWVVQLELSTTLSKGGKANNPNDDWQMGLTTVSGASCAVE